MSFHLSISFISAEENSDTVSEVSAGTSLSSASVGVASHTKQQRNEAPIGGLTLPNFSSGVKSALQEGNSSDVWTQMLDELVTYFARHYPNRLHCSEDYQTIGKMMYKSYSCIERYGAHPWVSKYFDKNIHALCRILNAN